MPNVDMSVTLAGVTLKNPVVVASGTFGFGREYNQFYDLGELGGELLCELFRRDGVDLSPSYTDCGRLIFDSRRQDVHCGGSGCGCSASVFTGYLLRELRAGRIKHLLFCPTGALHSPTTACQGESIPGICHAIALSNRRPAS